MLRIAICDDSPQDRKSICDAISDFFKERGMLAEVCTFASPLALLNEPIFSLYFLDIIMPEMNGLALAEKIRKRATDTAIAFITSSSEYALSGYSVDAMGYILKPVMKDQIHDVLRRILANQQRLLPPALLINVDHVSIDVSTPQILFAESRLRNTELHLFSGEKLVLHCKLEDFWKSAEPYSFLIRCHKSYIVNLSHVNGIDKSNFILKTGELIPISRSSFTESKTAYYKNKINMRYDG